MIELLKYLYLVISINIAKNRIIEIQKKLLNKELFLGKKIELTKLMNYLKKKIIK